MTNNDLLFLLAALITTWVYFPLNRRKSRFYWESPIDKRIPLIPMFVVPYYFFFVYMASAVFLLSETTQFRSALIAFILANLIASIFWYIFPNGIRRVRVKRVGFFFKWLNDLYWVDKHDTNSCPSNHVYGSTICTYYLCMAYPHIQILFVFIGASIVVSTIFVKQHHVIDLIAGLFLAASSIVIVGYF